MLAIAVATATICTGGFAAATTPAAAKGSPGCVTSKEFAKVKKGTSKAKVAKIFETKGKREVISRAGGYVMEVRSYDACTQFGVVSVSFDNGALSAKSAVF